VVLPRSFFRIPNSNIQLNSPRQVLQLEGEKQYQEEVEVQPEQEQLVELPAFRNPTPNNCLKSLEEVSQE
jgi:hypothetical protein